MQGKSISFQNKWVLIVPILVAVLSHLFVFLGIAFSWFGSSNGTGGEFCEEALTGLIKQPANTFSNLGFLIAGLTAAFQIYKGKFKNKSNPINDSLFFPIVLCSFMILLSPGSMAMHATETTLGGYFDMLSMYLIAAIIFSYAAYRLFRSGKIGFIFFFSFALVVCHLFHYSSWSPPLVGFAGSFAFGLFCALGVIFEILNKRINGASISLRWGLAASLTFVIAFAIWQVGYDDHPLCIPDSLLQAHAIWHLLDALAIYFFVRLYASEDKKSVNEI